MAKKKIIKKKVSSSVTKPAKKSRTKKKVTKKVSSKTKAKSKAVPKKSISKKKSYKKKVGRKPSVRNRYNSIKSAISSYYLSQVGRRVKQYELKVIYSWISGQYKKQSVRYVLMNIDVIIDRFWEEYCNLYPVDLSQYARFFDWYYLKTYLDDEKSYHYPSDIIQLDLSAIGADVFEFYFDDYTNKADEAYQLCKEAGFKGLKGSYPQYYLETAYCDIAKKGNVFKYVLILDGNIPSDIDDANAPAPKDTAKPISAPETQISAPQQTILTPEQLIDLEVQKERVKAEFELKQLKLKELAKLLKDKIISFNEYNNAVKEL